jgi:hypothetical protein
MRKPGIHAASTLLLFLLLALPISAQGAGNGFTPVDGLDNWKYGLDLGGYKSGKYNLVVEGRDKAGNVTRATPMNIFVDPKSDLPLVSIINPTPLLRVGGDLNIVGTAVDDDGVARVEVSLDGGEYVPAEGGEFWSLYLKTADLPEGRRTLDVRAVDVNGLVGPSVRVKFDLDRTKPLAAVDAPVVGSLVSGQIRLAGTVFDANGVRSLEISLDGGKAWAPVALKKGKDPLRPSFTWPVDTKKLGDGPKVFDLRSVDMVGSTSSTAYLVFVDNTVPAIEMARPILGQAVNGRFAVAGAVRDAVGVKRLSYEFGSGEKGEIPLTKGDPFFVKELDAGTIKGDSATVVLVAEDTIGNVTRLSRTFKIDRKADKPVLKLLGPGVPMGGAAQAKPGALTVAALREGEAIWGSIDDDDGAAAFRWSLDGGAPTEVACSEVFSLVLPPESPGRHALSLEPVDVNGLAGDPVVLSLSIDKGPGTIAFDRITSVKASRDFAQGIEVAVDSGEFLEGTVFAPNDPVAAEYSIAEGKPRPTVLSKGAASGSWRFRIALDRSLPYGFAPVTVRVKDGPGNSYEGKGLLYVTDYAVAREEAGFRFSDPRVGADGSVALGSLPLLGAFYGGELASLRFDPPTDLVAASFDGRTVSLSAAKEGRSAPTRILGKTTKGREFSGGPFTFITNSTPPKLQIDAPAEGTWFNSKILVSGRATNAVGPVSLSWRRLPDGQSAKVEPKPDGSFSIELSATDMGAGAFSIELEAKNPAGLVAHAYRSLGADARGPTIRFLSPEKGQSVWGPEDVAALVDSASGIASVEYAADGKSFAAIERSGSYFAHRADLAANPGAAYRVVDRAGNATVARPEVSVVPPPVRVPASPTVSVDPAAGEARVELSGTAGSLKASFLAPGLSEADFAALGDAGAAPPARFASRLLVQGALSFKGQATIDGQAKAVSISVDGGATYRLLASNKDAKSAKSTLPFALAIEAAKLPAGAARWTIKVEDFSGGAYFCPVYCLVDAKAPSVTVVYPEQGTQSLPGPFPFVVKVEDDNGLASGEIAVGTGPKESLDAASNGRYFVRMVDPSAMAKGAPLSLAISARDSAGNQSALAQKYGYDAAADAPKLRMDSLVAAAGGLISGLATDDDGAPALRASLDGGEQTAFPLGAFAFSLPELAAGKHLLTIEMDGASAPVKKEFSIKDAAPALGDFKIVDGKSSSSWTPGADFPLGAASALSGSVSFTGLIAGVSVSFNSGAALQAALGKAAPGAPQPFSIGIPATLPYGRVSIEIRAKDSTGLSSVEVIELHKVLPPSAGSDDDEGIFFADARIAAVDGKTSFLLSAGDRLSGRFNGRPIRSVTIQPATPALEASFDGTSVAITGKAEGLVPQASLELTTVDGDLFQWGPFSAAVDSSGPLLELSSPSDNDWVKGEARVAGKASDPQGIASLQVFVNGGEPLALADPAALGGKGELSFDKVVPLAAAPDGATRLSFVLRDGAGRETRVSRFINKDTLPPILTQVLPIVGESVNGLTTFVGEATDGGRLASAVFIAPVEAKAESPKTEPPKAETTKAGAPKSERPYFEGIASEAASPQVALPAETKPAEPKPVETKSEEVSGLADFSRDLDLARLALPLPAGCGFVVTDKAGNKAILSPTVVVDKEKDKPVAEINTPADMEVLRGDFAISGVAYDDDGLAAAYYRIDGGAWTRLEMQGTSFSVPIALKDTTDNEHLVEVKAEDIYGVQGDLVSRKYRISKEEPVAKMTAPAISKPVRGTVMLAGTASDANGIKEVTVSIDNRTSYDRPVGTDSWSIGLDTTTLSDGIHAVAVRPVDGYDTEGFYASMIAVDNTPPKAQMDLPRDDDEVAGSLLVSGRVSDNIAIASSRIEVAPVGSSAPPAMVIDLGTDKIVQRVIDVSGLKAGVYAVRLVVVDRADNEGLASRNVRVAGAAPLDSLSIVFPVEGERASGALRVQGRAIVASGAGTVSILADGAVLGAAEPDELGWYSFNLPSGALADGDHVLKARTSSKEGRVVESADTRLEWKSLGPWVSIDSFPSGKYLQYRPYLRGKAGWAAEDPPTGDKKALDDYRKAEKTRQVSAVEVSLDDGRSFAPAAGKDSWSFRLETLDYKEGALHAIVRARYADGSTASVKGLYFLDKTPPEVQVLAPTEGGRFNGALMLEGRAYDLNGMASVGVALRKGDKANYELPSFIQGLYVDGQMLGATTWEAGVGLTFFGDNVKLEAVYGKAPDYDSAGSAESFYGDVFGGKLIANVLYLPFDSLFGPNWSFLSTSIGIGANFTYFSQTQAGSGLLIGSIFGQLEFPKVTFDRMSVFKKISFYSEYQLWVLSSVVSGGFIPKVSFGARVGMF